MHVHGCLQSGFAGLNVCRLDPEISAELDLLRRSAFDHRIDHVCLPSRVDLLAHEFPHFGGPLVRHLARDDRGAPGWQLGESASVRGIGVAVMTSVSGSASPFFISLKRCITPKRCCSSTITRPSLWNSTFS